MDFRACFPTSELSVPELLRVKNHHYEANGASGRSHSGAVDFVLWAKKHYKIALATSGSPRNRESSLRMLGFRTPFSASSIAAQSPIPSPIPKFS